MKNCQQFREEWPLLRSSVQQRWPRITDEEVNRIDGWPHRLYHALIREAGLTRIEAAHEIAELIRTPEGSFARS